MRSHTHIDDHPGRVIRFVLWSLVILSTCWITPAQQRRAPAERANPQATKPATTFDTLLAADTYKIYGEVRGVGQLIRSNSFNELLEPIMKIAAPPKELGTLVKWVNKHADALMTSRMMIGGWPAAKNVPTMLVAIEFANAEEAERFEPQLNDFLPRVIPAPTPETQSSPEGGGVPGAKPKPTPPPPSYYLSRSGSLIFITPTRLTLKNLRPAGSKLLSEDGNFRTAHDRFSNEQVFVYVDFNGIQKEEEESAKQAAEAQKNEVEQKAAEVTSTPSPEASPEQSDDDTTAAVTEDQKPVGQTEPVQTNQNQNQQSQLDSTSLALGLFSSLFSAGPPKWPQGLGIAASLDNESLDAKVLMVNNPGEKSDAIPLVPLLIPGPAITPEGASIFPKETELLVSASLDWAQIYARLDKRENSTLTPAKVSSDDEPPFGEIEKKLGIKIKEDLLPLLGNELAVAMPVMGADSKEGTDASKEQSQQKPKEPSPLIALSIRDKAGMKVLLPKLIDSMGMKGASAFGQVEKQGDTEIVSFANAFAYAFVGNFLVLSPDIANVRNVVESYLKGETLSGDASFKNYTRWQPRQLQGQVYLSPALMESYKTWAQEPTALISDQTREFLSRMAYTSQPVTYSLSNDGLGSLHELHLPKNLLLMLVASISGETNPPPMLGNERAALAAVQMIAGAEIEYSKSKGNGSFATLDQLIANKDYLKPVLQNSNYKIEVTAAGDHFEVSAVPTEYGKTGRMSYYADQTMVVRGGDLSGAPATAGSKPIAQ